MPAEIVGQVIGGVIKMIGQLMVEVIFNIAIQGTGYLLCYPLNKHIDPESWPVVCVGLGFWVVLAAGAYILMT
ncbi:MAG: hypothetical protein RL180_1461 [Pseudomonadota bacterium]|jgi:hypothetical protein